MSRPMAKYPNPARVDTYSSAACPARTGSTIRRRKAGGYGGLDSGMMDTSSPNSAWPEPGAGWRTSLRRFAEDFTDRGPTANDSKHRLDSNAPATRMTGLCYPILRRLAHSPGFGSGTWRVRDLAIGARAGDDWQLCNPGARRRPAAHPRHGAATRIPASGASGFRPPASRFRGHGGKDAWRPASSFPWRRDLGTSGDPERSISATAEEGESMTRTASAKRDPECGRRKRQPGALDFGDGGGG